jgi:hypothetical protein
MTLQRGPAETWSMERLTASRGGNVAGKLEWAPFFYFFAFSGGALDYCLTVLTEPPLSHGNTESDWLRRSTSEKRSDLIISPADVGCGCHFNSDRNNHVQEWRSNRYYTCLYFDRDLRPRTQDNHDVPNGVLTVA